MTLGPSRQALTGCLLALVAAACHDATGIRREPPPSAPTAALATVEAPTTTEVCGILRIRISGLHATSTVELAEECATSVRPVVTANSYRRANATGDEARMSDLSISIALENATDGVEFGAPLGLIVATSAAEVIQGPPGQAEAGKPYISLASADSVTGPTDENPGLPFIDYSATMNQEIGGDADRLLPSERTAVRAILFSVHAGVREFTVPVLVRSSVVALSATIPASGGNLSHPLGAAVDIPGGVFGTAVRVRIEHLLEPLAAGTPATGTFEVAVTPLAPALDQTPLASLSAALAVIPTGLYYVSLPLLPERPVEQKPELVIMASERGSGEILFPAWTRLENPARLIRIGAVAIDPTRYAANLRAPKGQACSQEYYRLDAAEEASGGTPGGPPVVYIHGWQHDRPDCTEWGSFDASSGGGSIFAALEAADIHEARSFWRYTYPTYEPVDDAARDLAARIESRFPDEDGVVIIAHSMGGLVARRAIQHFGAGARVQRLITLGTPHSGTPLADLATAWTVSRRIETGNISTDLNTWGAENLRPGSDFISSLNGEPEDRSRYFSFAGDVRLEDNIICGLLPAPFLLSCGFVRLAKLFFEDTQMSSDIVVPTASAFLDGSNVESGFGVSSDLQYAHWNLDGLNQGDPMQDRIVELVAEVTGPRLLAHYSFDASTGADDTGNGHTGHVMGQPSELYVPGVRGSALHLQGGDDYFRVPAVTTNARPSGTVSMWMRTAGGTTRELCERRDLSFYLPFYCHYNLFAKEVPDNAPRFAAQLGGPLDTGSDRFYFQVDREGLGYVPAGAYTFASWHMYTFTWTPTEKRIFLDGSLLQQFPSTGPSPSDGDLLFGRNGTMSALASRERLQGDVDEIRIYGSALNDAEVRALFEAETLPPSGPAMPDLTALVSCDRECGSGIVLRRGQRRSIPIAFTNHGAAPVSALTWAGRGWLSRDLVLDDGDFYLIGTGGVALAPGETRSLIDGGEIPTDFATGPYYLIYKADVFAQISESDEANNVFTYFPVTVVDGG